MENNNDYEKLRLQNQLCFPLYSASRKIIGMYTPDLKPLGITYTQYLVFLVLWENKKLTSGEICKMLFLDNGTITPVIKKMEKDGYLLRERSKEDERVVFVSITEKGMNMRKAAKEIPEKIGICLPLEKEETIELHRLLYKILG